jgi:hypothetical protein
MNKELQLDTVPVYYLEIDDENGGISAISFVENPATKVNWFKFNEEVELKFEKNEMERIVTGPIMLAETDIWRKEGFYVKFSADQLKKMAKKFFKNGNQNNVNENHDQSRKVEGVFLIESYFVGEKVESNLFKDLPEGSWIGSFYVEDEKYWNDVIMSDSFSGFSLEGAFKQSIDQIIVENRFNDIEKILKSDLDEDIQFDAIKSLLYEYKK